MSTQTLAGIQESVDGWMRGHSTPTDALKTIARIITNHYKERQ